MALVMVGTPPETPLTFVGYTVPAAPQASPAPAAPGMNGFSGSEIPPSIDNANGNGNGKDSGESDYSPLKTFFRGYPWLRKAFPSCLGEPDEPKEGDDQPAPRRGFPAPFLSPPFPSAEFQGTPVPGQPLSTTQYPLTQALWSCGKFGEWLKDERIRAYGWINPSFNWSEARDNNFPDSYWIRARRPEMDQMVFKIEREVDSVQQDHIDFGFRSCVLWGQDYRFTTAAGWGANQLLANNLHYGWDPIEQYLDIYFPAGQGVILRIGRWVACPDIETQLAPDNYLGTHSILFTFDTYTQSGFELSWRVNDNLILQAGLNAGNDMAPWYGGATPCGFLGVRYDFNTRKDSLYVCLNQIDNAQFRHQTLDGQPAGHDNFNYIVGTYQHAFSQKFLTKQEAYYMWERNAELGGTPSIGPTQQFGLAGGDNPVLLGLSRVYGTVNYTCYAWDRSNFVTLRNEWWRDERGMRSGFPGTYTGHTVGWTHFFTPNLEFRPEAGYYRNWTGLAFDNGKLHGTYIIGADLIFRF
jgi:hypothetical protein